MTAQVNVGLIDPLRDAKRYAVVIYSRINTPTQFSTPAAPAGKHIFGEKPIYRGSEWK